MVTTHESHGALRADVGRWSDRPRGVHALTALATVAACYDAADQIHADEYAPLDHTQFVTVDDIEDTARVIAYRIMSRADRERRAVHTWWHGNVTRGDADDMAPAPDHHERVRAATRTTRTNRGATVDMVTRHGRAYVGGSTTARDPYWHGPTVPHACAMSAPALAYAIDTAPRTANGMVDAVSLARLTDIAYPDVPRLIGADVLSFEEFGAWDETRARTPRRGHGTRYRLQTIRPRAGELARARAGELLAPAADPDHVWIGHRREPRSTTVRAARAAQRRAVDDAVIVPDGAVLADVLAGIAASVPRFPYRVTWSHRGESGAITATGSERRPRYAVSGIAPTAVRGRTAAGIRAAITRATR